MKYTCTMAFAAHRRDEQNIIFVYNKIKERRKKKHIETESHRVGIFASLFDNVQKN